MRSRDYLVTFTVGGAMSDTVVTARNKNEAVACARRNITDFYGVSPRITYIDKFNWKEGIL